MESPWNLLKSQMARALHAAKNVNASRVSGRLEFEARLRSWRAAVERCRQLQELGRIDDITPFDAAGLLETAERLARQTDALVHHLRQRARVRPRISVIVVHRALSSAQAEAAPEPTDGGARYPTGETGNGFPSVRMTASESIIMTLLMDGLCNKEIAAHLDRSVKTIEYHVTKLLRKTATHSRLELVAKAMSKDESGCVRQSFEPHQAETCEADVKRGEE